MAIKRISTLPSLSGVRGVSGLCFEDILEFSVSGVPGSTVGSGDDQVTFNAAGFASIKAKVSELITALFPNTVSAGTFTGTGEYLTVKQSDGSVKYIPLYDKI